MERADLNPIPFFVCLAVALLLVWAEAFQRPVMVGQQVLFSVALLWLHLEVGGEDVLALGNQSAKVGAIAFDSHLNATRLNVLRLVYELDASPHGRDVGILEPNPELGG